MINVRLAIATVLLAAARIASAAPGTSYKDPVTGLDCVRLDQLIERILYSSDYYFVWTNTCRGSFTVRLSTYEGTVVKTIEAASDKGPAKMKYLCRTRGGEQCLMGFTVE